MDIGSPVKQDNISLGVKIGVIRDKVFSFYYPENLEALVNQGAELVYINSLTDSNLPPIDALYDRWRFPRNVCPRIIGQCPLRGDIKQAIEKGLPVYAECGINVSRP